jgi:hypothetical protein
MTYPAEISNGEAKRVVLEKLQLAFWNTMPAIGENTEVDIRQLSDSFDKVIMYVRSWILDGHKVDRIEPESIDFPATPWDFWKQEYAPKWFLERWPVKMKTTVVNKNIHKHFVCPHINIKEDRYPHIVWMYENSGQKKD